MFTRGPPESGPSHMARWGDSDAYPRPRMSIPSYLAHGNGPTPSQGSTAFTNRLQPDSDPSHTTRQDDSDAPLRPCTSIPCYLFHGNGVTPFQGSPVFASEPPGSGPSHTICRDDSGAPLRPCMSSPLLSVSWQWADAFLRLPCVYTWVSR